MRLSSRVDDFTSLFASFRLALFLDVAGNLNMHTSAIIIEAKQKIENPKKLSCITIPNFPA